MGNIGIYRKFLLAIVQTVLVGAVPALMDGVLSADEAINLVIIAFGAATVLGATNLPAGAWRYAKTIFAAGSAVAVAVASSFSDYMITSAEWVQIVIALLGALGVAIVPNVGAAPNGASTTATGLPSPLTAA